jgi:uncharacterized membrane protein
MTPSLFFLILFSSFCHAGWNFVARRAAGNLMAIWLGLWIGGLTLFPGVVLTGMLKGFADILKLTGILCTIATGLIHGIYFYLLAAGYRKGEISLVYPIARGSGIALTAILASVLLEERFSLLGSIGIGLVSAGIMSLSVSSRARQADTHTIITALGIGASIVAYSIVDKIGVYHVHPVPYIWAMFVLSAAVLTPAVLNGYTGNLLNEARRYAGSAAIIGVGSAGTYLMILFAFTMGPVGYIVAVREFSVVIGALGGIFFLHERFTVAKLFAVFVIFGGIVCIKLG